MIDKKILYSRAKLLRENMTEAECCLWDCLRDRRLAKLSLEGKLLLEMILLIFFVVRKNELLS